ncbi:MAG: hydrolase [Ramlibacter sp.]
MNLNEADRLLDPAPLRLETGWERLDDGVMHVACRTDLHGCTGAMFEWWFRSRPGTQQYVWWHPVDHVSSEWLGGSPDTHIGSVHKVEEFFSGMPAEKLLVQFRAAEEFFDGGLLRDARARGQVSAAVCGRGGHGWDAPRDPQDRVMGSRLLHLGRDTAWGCVLRSHFFIGQDLPRIGKSPGDLALMVPDELGPALLRHCYNEFMFLSRFLPSLYIAENRARQPVELPW